MELFEVENQINMQYLTQLLQNENFEIQKYQYRSNLWNADNLHSQELLSLFRQFKFYDSAKKQAAQIQIQQQQSNAAGIISNINRSPLLPGQQSQSRSFILNPSDNQEQVNPLPMNNQDQNGIDSNNYVELQVVEEGDDDINNLSLNHNRQNSFQSESILLQNNRSFIENNNNSLVRRQSHDPYTVKVILSETDEINFPATMQKYPFRQKVYDLTNYVDVVSKGTLRRLIFLSISGYIGFDNKERLELIKGAFLLEFDAFFEYLMKPSIAQILQFDENQQDEALEVLSFMWEQNIKKSMKYYDFIVKLATINSNMYKKDGQISPRILNLDVTIMETQFLPLIHRIMQTDVNLTQNQSSIIMKQIIEFYEIHNSKRIIYPFLQQKSEKDVSDQVEEKFQNLLKEFECPICFLPFDNCYTSKCGHSFCQTCIVNSVEKFGNCPVCQQVTTQNDLFRNFHMNEIKNIAYQEKEISKTNEINRLNHMNTFKEKFQEILQTNIINSISVQIDKQQQNNKNECVQSYEQVQKLKKQIQYLVNITFDQLMNSINIES